MSEKIELTKEEKKARRKERFKKILKVTGIAAGGAAIGVLGTFIGQKVFKKQEKIDPDIIVTTKQDLAECAKEVEKATFFNVLTTTANLCKKKGGQTMIARWDTDPDNPKYLMASLVDEKPDFCNDEDFLKTDELDIFGKNDYSEK